MSVSYGFPITLEQLLQVNFFLPSRANRMKILEYLYDAWAVDRKAEWSIWMVYSKIDMPHRYLRSAAEESSYRNALGKVVTRKSNDEVV